MGDLKPLTTDDVHSIVAMFNDILTRYHGCIRYKDSPSATIITGEYVSYTSSPDSVKITIEKEVEPL